MSGVPKVVTLSVSEATTIGYKRILRILRVSSDRVRIHIRDATAAPALSTVSVYEASPDETAG